MGNNEIKHKSQDLKFQYKDHSYRAMNDGHHHGHHHVIEGYLSIMGIMDETIKQDKRDI